MADPAAIQRDIDEGWSVFTAYARAHPKTAIAISILVGFLLGHLL